jgi:hypothetical protein
MSDTTHEAPERIWAKPNIGRMILHNPAPNLDALIARGYLTEYVRADLVQAAVAAALREAAAHIAPHPDHDRSDWTEYAHQAWRNSRSILAFITPDAQAALDRVVANHIGDVNEMVAAERERCAKVVDTEGLYYAGLREGIILDRVAAAIRKGGE